MAEGLPTPVTTDQEYLAAILDELRQLRVLVAALQPVEVSAPGEVELVEAQPAKRSRKKTNRPGQTDGN